MTTKSAWLQRTFDVMLDFSRAVSAADLHATLLKHSNRYGASCVVSGVVPTAIIKPSEQPNFLLFGRWPIEWAERYFTNQYVRKDPIIRHCIVGEKAQRWAEIRSGSSQSKAIMSEATSFGLRDGIVAPMLGLNGMRMGVSFGGERLDDNPNTVMDLSVLGSYAVSRALEISATAQRERGEVSLAPRERECLIWASEGKGNSDIADILGLTNNTVEKYLASARHKLNALNTTQAAVRALKLGMI